MKVPGWLSEERGSMEEPEIDIAIDSPKKLHTGKSKNVKILNSVTMQN